MSRGDSEGSWARAQEEGFAVKRITTEVLVVGGGTAGVMAAYSAARNGAKVILAERDGALGGVATRAGIHLYYYGLKAGSQVDLDEQVERAARAIGWAAQGFHPEAKRLVSVEVLSALGVEIVFHAQAVEVVKSGTRVQGVVFETPEESLRIDAVITVDATGDGDVCALAGASYTVGRDWDQVMNNYSLVPRCLYNDRIAPFNVDGGWVDSTSVRDVTRAYVEGRAHIFRLLGDAIAPVSLISMPPQLGVREGRLIVGEETLTLADLVENRMFPDAVMRCMTHFDTHAYDFANESLEAQVWVCVMGLWRERIGSEVPYRCFIPKGIDGILVGCRALSLSHDAAVGLRMQRDIQQAGEVAGTAAALCVALRCEPRELDVVKLQERLAAQGVLDLEPKRQGQRAGGRDRPWVQLQFEGLPEDGLTPESLQCARVIERLIDALATEQAGKAMWWLRRAGPKGVELLKARLARLQRETATVGRSHRAGRDGNSEPGAGKGDANTAESEAQRGTLDHLRAISMALALAGDGSGRLHLLESVKSLDMRTPPGVRAAPHWIASLICLKLLRDPCAVDFLVERLPKEQHADAILHVLHYFLAVVDVLDERAKERVRQAVHRLHAWPERGAEYRVWGGVPQSIEWSIDLACAALLIKLSDPKGMEILEQLSRDSRGYVRRAARWIHRRFTANEGPRCRESVAPPSGDQESYPDNVGFRETLGRYDVVISGGGLGGLACALALSERGYKTLIVDRRGGLGWEVSRARRVFYELDLEQVGSPFLARLFRALRDAGGLLDGVVHAPIAELVFDRLAVAQGVDLLFHAQPVRVEADENTDAAARLVVATRQGYGWAGATWIVETDPWGRLVPEHLRSPVEREASAASVRSIVVKGVDANELRQKYSCRELSASLGFAIRPLSGTLLQIDIPLRGSSAVERERSLRPLIEECLERLRSFDDLFARVGVVYIADEEWAHPSFAIQTLTSDFPSDNGSDPIGFILRAFTSRVERVPLFAADFAREGRLILAGPWLDKVLAVSSTEEVSVINRVLVGESAARVIESWSV